MPEADVNGLFSAVATEADVLPARRRPLKIVGESAAMIGSPGSLCVFMVAGADDPPGQQAGGDKRRAQTVLFSAQGVDIKLQGQFGNARRSYLGDN